MPHDRPAATARQIDIAPLRQLLGISSRQDAAALLSALHGDLLVARSGLDQAWNGPDFAALRANSHVLIALAGTIGDTNLHVMAQHLNALAHGQNAAELLDMKSGTMTTLTELIDVLRRLQDCGKD